MKEEKRKQFNASEFISNKETPVETRDGRKVEIYTVNRKDDDYPVVGDIIDECIPELRLWSWSKKGKVHVKRDSEFDYDLFFSAKKRKLAL